jgi:ectoine hydroxylase-related dioxygenase (phytanoyl-CoA dioxygenase family)
MSTTVDIARLKADYERDGFCVASSPFPADMIEAACRGADAVLSGEFETGHAPRLRQSLPSEEHPTLAKIAQPHYANDALRELVASPDLGRLAAALVGARMVQAWAVDLFAKEPSTAETSSVGWHQDGVYTSYWEGDTLTAWIALSEVAGDSAPLRYVRGSHLLGPVSGGDLYSHDLENVRRALSLPPDFDWKEVAVTVPRGGVAFHHHLTLHASGPNRSAELRVALAVRLRTERCRLAPGSERMPQVDHLDDGAAAPVFCT